MNLQVYSVGCAWTGPIEKVGKTPPPASLPCCPHCGSVLMQGEKEGWWKAAQVHEDNGHPGYVALLKWIEQQPRCYKTFEQAKAAKEASENAR